MAMSDKTKKSLIELITQAALVPILVGWFFMLLAGILHVKFGFPLFGYWESVGTVFLYQAILSSASMKVARAFKAVAKDKEV